MNSLNIIGRIADQVSTYCLLCKPKDVFIQDRGNDVRISHPTTAAEPEGMGR